jgi:hypothetical protein
MVRLFGKKKIRARRLRLKLKRGQKRPRIITRLNRQTGSRKDKEQDLRIIALPSGERESRKGKRYWETRKNRSDLRDNL